MRWELNKSSQTGGAQSVRKAIAVIRTVAHYGSDGVRLSRIARANEFNISTARRILTVLVEEGFLLYDPISKLYNIGLDLYSIASETSLSLLRNTYRIVLERIAQKTEDTVYLIVPVGYDTLCIDRVEGASSIKILFNVGRRLPLGIGSSGIALLMFEPESSIETVLSNNELRYHEYNKMTVGKVKQNIEKARSRNYALSEGSLLNGVNAVGLPIFNLQGKTIASITVASIAERMPQNRCDEIAALIKSEIALIKPLP
jgi:DNA-binding IclR family transcriptional regulator